jgi:hypothetical protein
MDLSRYEWFKDGPDFMYGVSERGFVYCIGYKGKINMLLSKSVDSGWSHASLDEVKQYIEKERLKTDIPDIEWQDLELFEKNPDTFYGVDKKGNLYAIGDEGQLILLPAESADISWSYASISEVKQYIEIQKKLKLERSKKKQKGSPKNLKKKPEILPPDINGFTTYYERISHGLELTNIMFTETRIIITDSTDYFDSDSERNEYYIIEPNNYLELINKLENEYKPVSVKNLSSETRTYYNLFKNENLKKLFLLALSIIGYDKNIKHETEKYMRGDELIKLLCGDAIKFKKEYYSKGL